MKFQTCGYKACLDFVAPDFKLENHLFECKYKVAYIYVDSLCNPATWEVLTQWRCVLAIGIQHLTKCRLIKKYLLCNCFK